MNIQADYRSLRAHGRSRRAAVRWLFSRYVTGGLPLRVQLVWFAMRGRPIVHRGTFHNGTLVLPDGALVARCAFIDGLTFEGPAIRAGGSE